VKNDKVRVVQTLLFMTGINTLLQTLFGTRLPAVVGGSYAFLIPIISIIRDSSLMQITDGHEVCGEEPRRFRCVGPESLPREDFHGFLFSLFSLMQRFLQSMRAIQGALIVSSGVQIIIGFSQLWALFSRHDHSLSLSLALSLYHFLSLHRSHSLIISLQNIQSSGNGSGRRSRGLWPLRQRLPCGTIFSLKKATTARISLSNSLSLSLSLFRLGDASKSASPCSSSSSSSPRWPSLFLFMKISKVNKNELCI